jgi:dTDP-4-dehydrorhamnose 3,5-epimerase
MKLIETKLQGVFLLEPKIFQDDRGFFTEIFNQNTLRELKLEMRICQVNLSSNKKQGTIRGMHYQIHPFEEEKVILCTQGAIFDVVVDIRPTSPSFGKWMGFNLSEKAPLLVFIPKGLAHGYQVLEDDSQVTYFVSEFYHPESARGVRWNDPAFQIKWPINADITINERDSNYPDFKRTK